MDARDLATDPFRDAGWIQPLALTVYEQRELLAADAGHLDRFTGVPTQDACHDTVPWCSQ